MSAPHSPHTTSRFGTTDGLLVAMAVIWGVNISVVKYATAVIDPLAYNAVRVTLAALAMLALAAVVRDAADQTMTRRDVLVLISLGMLGNGLYQLGFVEGVARTRAGDAALVIAASPAMVALIGRIAGVERVNRRGLIGIALSVAGIALVVFGATAGGAAGEGSAHTTLVGSVMLLVGSACWALFSVFVKPYANRVGGLTLGALTMGGGAIALLAISMRQLATVSWMSVPAAAWWAILYSGLGSLVVAYLFWQRGVRVLGPTRTAMYSNLQPVIALGVAWMALGEVPTGWQATGAATIIAGVVMTRG